MKQSLKLGNSIYQQRGGGGIDGLTVNDGMLINNRPDGVTGISQASQVRKSMKESNKISIIARGTSMGELISKSVEVFKI